MINAPYTTRDHSERKRQSGIALLIVLACLVLVVPICADFAMQSAINKTSGQINHQLEIIEDIEYAVEIGPVLHWLKQESPKVVLPPEVITPHIAIMQESLNYPVNYPDVNNIDNITADKIKCDITISAWDQCGMVPLSQIKAGSPMRMTLPDAVLQSPVINNGLLLDKIIKNQPGLDNFYIVNNPGTSSFLNIDHGIPVFPDQVNMDNAIGAQVSTFQTADNAISRINVNTAPIKVLESTMLITGRNGIEQIIQVRQQGKTANVPAVSVDSNIQDNNAPQLVSVSNCWSFRIDIKYANVKRAWWLVYQKSSLTRNQWECVQRLVIPE